MRPVKSLAAPALFLAIVCLGDGAISGPEPVTFEKVQGGLYEVIGGRGSRNALFIGETGAILIDTKMDKGSMDAVLDGIKELTDKPLLYLINTHSDGDHVSGNRYVPEEVAVISHENCRDEFFHPLRNGEQPEWKDPALAKYLPQICFRDSLTIHLGADTVRLQYFGPGHTTGDTVVYFPAMKIAVIGDQYAGDSPPYIHDFKGGTAFGHIANLERMLAEINAEIFVSGHSAPVEGDAIERQISEMKARIEQVRSKISAGADPDAIKDVPNRRESMLLEAICKELNQKKQ